MASRKYSMNKYINAISAKIYANQTLCKYLYYDEVNPQAQSDIIDTSILYTDTDNQRLIFQPFVQTVDNSRMTKLSVVIDNVDTDRTSYFKLINLDCIIICHNELWNVDIDDGDIGIRPLLIWDELDSLFVNETSRGVGDDNFSYVRLIYFNDNYTGYKICYKSVSLPI